MFPYLIALAADTPDAPSLPSLLTLIPSLGGTGVLILFSWLWYSGKIVTRRELDESKAICSEWKTIALRSLDNTERGVGIAERATEVAKEVVVKNGRNSRT